MADAPPTRTMPTRDRLSRSAVAPPGRDAVLAGAVAALGGGAAGGMAAALDVGAPALTAGLVAAEALVLPWRRRAPVAVLALALAAGWAVAAVPSVAFTPLLAAVVATYTVAVERPWPLAVGAGVAAAVGSVVVVRGLLDAEFPFHVTVVPADHVANYLAGATLVFGAVTALGTSLRARRAHTASVEERAARLARERAERERRAVLEERARIARELHDVAAHHLSGLVLQAGALERSAEHDPERVRELAGEVREGGATALASMRRLVGLLRAADDEPEQRGSQPCLGDVAGLVEQARRDGLEVTLATDDVLDRPVPDEVGLAVYRLVQEALSNARRHAPGARAQVALGRDDGRLTVEVADDGGDGVPLAPTGDEAGQGVIGMRERVGLLSGELEVGPRDSAGWRVRATLPLEGEETR